MSNSNIWRVQGFCVNKVTVQKDKVKIDLVVKKDDLSAQEATIGDILASFEAHSTGEYPVDLSLMRTENTENGSYSVPGFLVNKVMFSTDTLKVSLESEKEAIVTQEGDLKDILGSLGTHSSGEQAIEVIIGRCNV